MILTAPYSPQGFAERLLAAGRLVLATFCLLAVWLDPSEPAKYAELTYSLMACYVGYSLVLAVVGWRSDVTLVRFRLWTHGFDLLLFVLLIYLTEGPPTSPFSIFFHFLLFCGMIRWQWQGTLWTAAIAFPLFLGMGLYSAEVLHDPDFDLTPFISRSVYIVVATALLCYLGAYQRRLSSELSQLAAWPKSIAQDVRTVVQDTLQYAAAILGAPRALLVFEDPEEPWLNWILWSQQEWSWTRKPVQHFSLLVAEPLRQTDFLCPNLAASPPTVLQRTDAALQQWQGQPLSDAIQTQLQAKAVISFRLQGEDVSGRLFFLDQTRLTSDDLVLGEIVANEISTRLSQFYLHQRLRESAVLEERIRLARDLHDGLLQSLTVTSIQLEAAQRSLEHEPHRVREQLAAIQRHLVAEQRELRFFIQEMKPPFSLAMGADSQWTARLTEMVERIGWQWEIHIDLRIEQGEEALSTAMTREVRLLLHEALVNAARHGHAKTVYVSISRAATHVHIQVKDDGRGFPFRGHYDLSSLIEKNLGPATLRDRIVSLHGTLRIESTDLGSHLSITLPLLPTGGEDVHSPRPR